MIVIKIIDHAHLSQRLLSSAGFPLASRSRASRVSGSLANVPNVTWDHYHEDHDDHVNVNIKVIIVITSCLSPPTLMIAVSALLFDKLRTRSK